jgi:AraC-like DNA-binding protein
MYCTKVQKHCAITQIKGLSAWGFREVAMVGSGVALEYVRAILEGLPAMGMDPKAFCAQFPELALDMDHLPAQVSVDQWALLLKRVVTYSGEAEMPTQLAQNMRPYQLGMLGYLVMTSQTLGDVVNALGHYELLLDGMNKTEVVRTPDQVELHWLPLTPEPLPVFMKMALTTWVVMAQFLTRQTLVGQADFTCEAPQDEKLYEQIFGIPARFNQAVTRVVFPAHYMDFPIAQSHAHMHDLLKAQADIQINRMKPEVYMIEALEAAILNMPANIRPDLGSLAAALNMSRRTLQYRLEGMGLTFRKFLDAVRSRQAEALLRDPDRSLSDIADSLGFADQSGFQHAFKRWRGLSPGDYRRQWQSQAK